jgi:hypothetical protein
MKIRIINKFHNVDVIVSLRKPLTYETYKRHMRRGCKQKDCKCDTNIYRVVETMQEADMYTKCYASNPSAYWKRVDPVDLELRDNGYGVKI